MDSKSFKDNFIKILTPLIMLLPVAIIAFVYVTCFGPDKENLEINNQRVIITECHYPLKSIFNKSTLILEPSQIIYRRRGLWGLKKMTMPFSNIKKVTFKQGVYFYSMRLHKKGFFPRSFSVYYKDEATDTQLKATLHRHIPNIQLVETDSLLRDMETLLNKILN